MPCTSYLLLSIYPIYLISTSVSCMFCIGWEWYLCNNNDIVRTIGYVFIPSQLPSCLLMTLELPFLSQVFLNLQVLLNSSMSSQNILHESLFVLYWSLSTLSTFQRQFCHAQLLLNVRCPITTPTPLLNRVSTLSSITVLHISLTLLYLLLFWIVN